MANRLVLEVARRRRRAARQASGWLLLAAYLMAGQLAPFAHVSTHRPDHSHGPGAPSSQNHDDDHDHEVPPPTSARTDEEDNDHDHPHPPTDLPAAPADPAPATPNEDHEAGSILHFDLALIDEPAPHPLPAPGDAVIAPVALALVWATLVAADGEPTRGPPLS